VTPTHQQWFISEGWTDSICLSERYRGSEIVVELSIRREQRRSRRRTLRWSCHYAPLIRIGCKKNKTLMEQGDRSSSCHHCSERKLYIIIVSPCQAPEEGLYLVTEITRLDSSAAGILKILLISNITPHSRENRNIRVKNLVRKVSILSL
jgi:hypothetical protein